MPYRLSVRLHTLEIYPRGKDFPSTPQSLSGRSGRDKYRAPDRNRQSTLVLQRAPSHDKFTDSTRLIPVPNNGRDHQPSPLISFTSLKLILPQFILILSPDRLLSLPSRYLIKLLLQKGHAVVQLVEALRYKLEFRGFDSRWCHWNFSFT